MGCRGWVVWAAKWLCTVNGRGWLWPGQPIDEVRVRASAHLLLLLPGWLLSEDLGAGVHTRYGTYVFLTSSPRGPYLLCQAGSCPGA